MKAATVVHTVSAASISWCGMNKHDSLIIVSFSYRNTVGRYRTGSKSHPYGRVEVLFAVGASGG
jgi:hypothetical protein